MDEIQNLSIYLTLDNVINRSYRRKFYFSKTSINDRECTKLSLGLGIIRNPFSVWSCLQLNMIYYNSPEFGR